MRRILKLQNCVGAGWVSRINRRIIAVLADHDCLPNEDGDATAAKVRKNCRGFSKQMNGLERYCNPSKRIFSVDYSKQLRSF